MHQNLCVTLLFFFAFVVEFSLVLSAREKCPDIRYIYKYKVYSNCNWFSTQERYPCCCPKSDSEIKFELDDDSTTDGKLIFESSTNMTTILYKPLGGESGGINRTHCFPFSKFGFEIDFTRKELNFDMNEDPKEIVCPFLKFAYPGYWYSKILNITVKYHIKNTISNV